MREHPADKQIDEEPTEEAMEHTAPHPSSIEPDPDEEWPDENGDQT